MTLAAAVAAALFLGVVFYAVLGGADFGSGCGTSPQAMPSVAPRSGP